MNDTAIKIYLKIPKVLHFLGINCRSYIVVAIILLFFGRRVKPTYLLVTRIRIYDNEDQRT